MVYVRLAKDWTDGDGRQHRAGDMVDLDAGTLAALESDGVVVSPNSAGWTGPGGAGNDNPSGGND
jgi:hypothetical protein